MLKVGITGNMGSGKTTVSRMFELLGVPVFQADEQARHIQRQPDVREAVARMFGADCLDGEGQIDRKKLAGIVFNNPAALDRLNSLIHPLVHKAFDAWVADQQAAYVLYEAAILVETGRKRDFDRTILVTAPENVRISRVMSRDGSSEEDVRKRMQYQFAQDILEKEADYVITNDGNTLIIPQVLEIDRLLRILAEK